MVRCWHPRRVGAYQFGQHRGGERAQVLCEIRRELVLGHKLPEGLLHLSATRSNGQLAALHRSFRLLPTSPPLPSWLSVVVLLVPVLIPELFSHFAREPLVVRVCPARGIHPRELKYHALGELPEVLCGAWGEAIFGHKGP